MTKKNGNQKQRKKEAKKAELKEKSVSKEEETEDTFDFGGLPRRDLKKNLGCG